MDKNKILEKIKDKSLKIGVVGLGYVGLPLAVEKAGAGFETTGFDVQAEKVEKVNNGINYIGDVIPEKMKQLVDEGKLKATTDYSFIKDMDFIAICVPTPLNAHQAPELDYVKSSATEIGKHMSKDTMIVLESTTYPGTTEELIKPILEKESGLKCEEDFYLGFSPERVDPGNAVYKTKNTPKVVGAIGQDALDSIAAVYNEVLEGDVYKVTSPAVAEMEKILENTFRNVNIGLVNELAILCHEMDIDIWEVIKAASTKPYGFMPFYPGPGLGGHCIPLDPYYLTWKAKEYKFHTSMIESSMIINDKMPQYVIDRSMEILNKDRKSLNGANVLVLGIAYKADIDDYRESPSLEVIDKLKAYGANVKFYDPYIREYKYKGKLYSDGLKELSDETIKESDLIVVTTNHSKVDYERICKLSKRVFDTKNALVNVKNRDKIDVL